MKTKDISKIDKNLINHVKKESFAINIGVEITVNGYMQGLYIVRSTVRNIYVIIHLSNTAKDTVLISDALGYFSIVKNTPGKINVYRTVDDGQLFIQNNALYDDTIAIYSFA